MEELSEANYRSSQLETALLCTSFARKGGSETRGSTSTAKSSPSWLCSGFAVVVVVVASRGEREKKQPQPRLETAREAEEGGGGERPSSSSTRFWSIQNFDGKEKAAEEASTKPVMKSVGGMAMMHQAFSDTSSYPFGLVCSARLES